MTIKNIVQRYKNGKLNNETDGVGKLGFWDLAGETALTYSDKVMERNDILDLQETIYQVLSILYREMDKK